MTQEIARLLDPANLANFIEVFVLSILLFGLLTFLRGTRGEGMLKSLGVFLAVGFIGLRGAAQHFDLARLTLVLDAIFQASIIALVVIFQPELRRGLALKIGEKWFTQTVPEQQVFEEVATAAARLSRTKEGALIAIERKDGLKNYVTTGTTIDAIVKAELLANIFWPGAPLHDGAVVIQNGRIMAAGCFLPLSENPDISKQLGTRHRAAIGLSEVEDAIVVVVSEETGTISVAEGGRLHRELDRESLLQLLHDLFAAQDDEDEAPPQEGLPEGGGAQPGGKTTTRMTRRILPP